MDWIGFASGYRVLRQQLKNSSLIKKTRPAKVQRKKPLYNAQGAGGAAEQTDKWFLLQYDLLFACHWSGPTKRQQFVRTEKIAPLA